MHPDSTNNTQSHQEHTVLQQLHHTTMSSTDPHADVRHVSTILIAGRSLCQSGYSTDENTTPASCRLQARHNHPARSVQATKAATNWAKTGSTCPLQRQNRTGQVHQNTHAHAEKTHTHSAQKATTGQGTTGSGTTGSGESGVKQVAQAQELQVALVQEQQVQELQVALAQEPRFRNQ